MISASAPSDPVGGAAGRLPDRQRILMIGGVPRSGTTLLSSLLQSRLNIPVAPETHFFNIALRRGADRLPAEQREDPRIMAAYAGLDLPGAADPLATFRTLLGRLITGAPPVIGEKTPDHLMHFAGLLAADPDICALVIVRRCAEVCNSLAGMPWNSRPTLGNLKLWVKFYLEAARLRRTHPGRVAVIGYERLCDDPDGTLARAAAELGLERNPDGPAAGPNFDAGLAPWKTGSDGPVRPAARSGTPNLTRGQRLASIAADRLLRLFVRIPGLA